MEEDEFQKLIQKLEDYIQYNTVQVGEKHNFIFVPLNDGSFSYHLMHETTYLPSDIHEYISYIIKVVKEHYEEYNQLIWDINEVNEERAKQVRELDVALNGDGAAKRPLLIDIQGQLFDLIKESKFLCDRLYDFEQVLSSGDASEDILNEYESHVSPSVARLKSLFYE